MSTVPTDGGLFASTKPYGLEVQLSPPPSLLMAQLSRTLMDQVTTKAYTTLSSWSLSSEISGTATTPTTIMAGTRSTFPSTPPKDLRAC